MTIRSFLSRVLSRAAAAALLACALLPAPRLRADAAPVDLKKWPKNDPIEAVLTKDERALYKTLADDAHRHKFIEFVYARRSSEGRDFHDFMTAAIKSTHAYAIFKIEPHGGGDEDEGARASAPASAAAAEDHRKVLYQSWETEIGKVMIGFGLPDHLGDDEKDGHYLLLTYSRELPGNLPKPFLVRFFKTPVQIMGSSYPMLQRSSKLPADSLWALILPPAAAAWLAYQADPLSVRLKECVALAPGYCAKAAPAPSAAGNGGGEGDADTAPGAVAAGGKIKDPEFAAQYPGDGALAPTVTVNTLPTQVAGDTEVRLIISLPGAPFTAQAQLLPLEGSTGGEQEFVNPAAGAKKPEPVFKGVEIKGTNYLEARRAVIAGRYRLAVVVTRGADFGRVVQAQVNIPRYDDGKLTATNIIFAATPEKAKAGDPLTLGDLRIIPHTGAYKPGETFSLFMVTYGAVKKDGYRLKTELTYQLVAEPVNVADRKINFGDQLKVEKLGAAFSSASPLIGTEVQVPAAPPAATVTKGKVSRQVPLRWKSFKIKAKITDENGASAPYETGWREVQLEK